MGPGSQTNRRLLDNFAKYKKGEKYSYYDKNSGFIAPSDLISSIHDIRYSLAKNEKDIKFAD